MEAWYFSSSQYVQATVKNVESYLATIGKKLPNRADTPMMTLYRPKLDVSPELEAQDATYYQSIIAVLFWMAEQGRVDICLEVSMMSSYLALPRDGHLNELYHIFSYLKKYHNKEMVFDPSDAIIDENELERKDWTSSEFGGTTSKELPKNMLHPRGQGFTISSMVDADHAGDTITRRS